MCSNAGIFIRDQGNVTEKKMCNCRKWPYPWNGTQAEGQEQQDEALRMLREACKGMSDGSGEDCAWPPAL